MKKKIIWIIISFLFFCTFLIFTYLVKEDVFNKLDFNITVKLQDNLPKKYDQFLSIFSLIGSFEILSGLILLIIFFKRKIAPFFIFIPFTVAHLIEIVGKTLLNHPGPPHMFFRYNIDFLFPSSYVQPGSSYPSGHSFRTIFITFIFFYLIFKSKMKIALKLFLVNLLIIVNGMMLVSRVSLGEHWTTDVVGGALLGISASIFSFLFL